MKIHLLSLVFTVFGFSATASTTMAYQESFKSITFQKPEKMTLLANPVKDGVLKLSIAHVQSENINVIIINSLGKRVFEAKRSLNKQTQVYDISSLASGIYFLRVNTEQSNFVKKLIIQ